MTDIVDKLRESYSHLNRDDALTSNSVDTIRKAVSEIEWLRDALRKIGGITMSMCLNYKDMAETQRDIARAALKESGQ